MRAYSGYAVDTDDGLYNEIFFVEDINGSRSRAIVNRLSIKTVLACERFGRDKFSDIIILARVTRKIIYFMYQIFMRNLIEAKQKNYSLCLGA